MDSADWVLLVGILANVFVIWYWRVGRRKTIREDGDPAEWDGPETIDTVNTRAA